VASITDRVKKIVSERGFGFINDTDGREVFFHQSSLVGVEFNALNGDEKVQFEVENTPKGPRAVNVTKVA
jgi:CspA family cold shock protein